MGRGSKWSCTPLMLGSPCLSAYTTRPSASPLPPFRYLLHPPIVLTPATGAQADIMLVRCLQDACRAVRHAQQPECAFSLHAFLHHGCLCHHVPVSAASSDVTDCAIEVTKAMAHDQTNSSSSSGSSSSSSGQLVKAVTFSKNLQAAEL